MNLGYFVTAEEAALCYARAGAEWEANLCSVSVSRTGASRARLGATGQDIIVTRLVADRNK